MTSGGSSPQGVPKACKKAGFAPTGAVCRSCTTMPVSTGASPPGGKGGTPFPALVPGAGTLPVGFQGRSALVAPRGAKSRFKKFVHGVKYRKSVFSFLTGHGFSDILCLLFLSLL